MKTSILEKKKKTIVALSTTTKAEERSEKDSGGYLKRNCNIKSHSALKKNEG